MYETAFLILFDGMSVLFVQKIVVANKETLIQLRTSFDKPDMMRDLSRKLQSKFHLFPVHCMCARGGGWGWGVNGDVQFSCGAVLCLFVTSCCLFDSMLCVTLSCISVIPCSLYSSILCLCCV